MNFKVFLSTLITAIVISFCANAATSTLDCQDALIQAAKVADGALKASAVMRAQALSLMQEEQNSASHGLLKVSAKAYNFVVPFMIKNLELQIKYLSHQPEYTRADFNALNLPLNFRKSGAQRHRVDKSVVVRANNNKKELLGFAEQTLEKLKLKESEINSSGDLTLFELIDLTDRYSICIIQHNISPLEKGAPENPERIHQLRMKQALNKYPRVPVIMISFASIPEVNTATAQRMDVFLLPEAFKLYDFDQARSASGALAWEHDWDHQKLSSELDVNIEELSSLRERALADSSFTDQDRELLEAIYLFLTHEDRSIGNTLLDRLLNFSDSAKAILLDRLKTRGDMLGAVRDINNIKINRISEVTEKMIEWLKGP